MANFEDKHLDVLQNIEFGIMEVYRAEPALIDADVQDAVDALVRHYHAEEEQRQPPPPRLADRSRHVFESVQPMCEWRLGKKPAPGEDPVLASPIAVSDMVGCLRQIQRSIRRWNGVSGRRGYLEFISNYFP